jgi:hypothetical protein
MLVEAVMSRGQGFIDGLDLLVVVLISSSSREGVICSLTSSIQSQWHVKQNYEVMLEHWYGTSHTCILSPKDALKN